MSAPAPQMTSGSAGAGITLGEDEDTFERDLKEMLKEGPSLNDMSSTVQVQITRIYIHKYIYTHTVQVHILLH